MDDQRTMMIWEAIDSAHYEVTLFAVACFIVFATDELMLDVIRLVRLGYRRRVIYRLYERGSATTMPS
jgi:hypothetical protein